VKVRVRASEKSRSFLQQNKLLDKAKVRWQVKLPGMAIAWIWST